MADPAAVARARIQTLRAEIADLEQFLSKYAELSRDDSSAISPPEPAYDVPDGGFDEGNEPFRVPVENSEHPRESGVARPRRRKPGAPKPAAIADLMERIIRERGAPMTRGEIVAALEARDVVIPYEDKSRYVGTIAWRHKGLFENVEGRGYWLRGEPVPSLAIHDAPQIRPRQPLDDLPEFAGSAPGVNLFD